MAVGDSHDGDLTRSAQADLNARATRPDPCKVNDVRLCTAALFRRTAFHGPDEKDVAHSFGARDNIIELVSHQHISE